MQQYFKLLLQRKIILEYAKKMRRWFEARSKFWVRGVQRQAVD